MVEKSLYTIGEFAKLTEVTERTLRYYDKKSLLKPSEYNAQGHRMYSDKDIIQLQKILTLKFLDFSLEEIAEQLQHSESDWASSLNLQHELLLKKREHLDKVIDTLERVQNILQETKEMETDYLLMLIYTLQHEEKQKTWFLQRFSQKTVDALFLEDRPEVKFEFERKAMSLISELQKFRREGKSPVDPEVQKKGKELLELILSSVDPAALEELTQQVEDEELLDPILFPDFFKGEETFLSQVFENLDRSGFPGLLNETELANDQEGDSNDELE